MPKPFFVLPTAAAPPMAERKLLRGDFFRAAHVEPRYALLDRQGLGRAAGEPALRAFWVRLVLAKMSGMFLFSLAACLGASSSASAAARRDAALCAAITGIASAHYYWISCVRAQRIGYASAFDLPLVAAGAEDTESTTETQRTVGQKLFAQELAVDQLRLTDWISTTTLLSLSLGLLSEEINPKAGEDSLLQSVPLLVLLTPFVCAIGTTSKSFLNDLRPSTSGVSQSPGNWVLGVGCFVVSLALFSVVSADLVLRVGDPTRYAGDAQVTAYSILVAQLLQVGYPLVAAIEAAWLRSIAISEDEYSAALSAFKSICYGCLDTGIKAGLALFAGMRCFS